MRSDRWISELEAKETKLQDEIDQLKQDRDRKIMDFQNTLDREKDIFKAKFSEAEWKMKEAE